MSNIDIETLAAITRGEEFAQITTRTAAVSVRLPLTTVAELRGVADILPPGRNTLSFVLATLLEDALAQYRAKLDAKTDRKLSKAANRIALELISKEKPEVEQAGVMPTEQEASTC